MFGPIFWAVVGVGIALVIIAVVFYVQVLRRGRSLGTTGAVQRSHLTCPKCHQEFDYDWVPGVSLTAVRLGTSRYMACPLCGRWSTFDIYGGMVARTPPPPAGV
ncbi:MAG: hypothetical protein ACRECT_07910 [Thermoplasmata archaeon]